MMKTKALFRDDAYLTECNATVLGINEKGILLDQTVFYPAGGGQPGDTGKLRFNDTEIEIISTVKDNDSKELLHQVADMPIGLSVGDSVTAIIDWPRRYLHMRMHTALHLLCAIVPCGVTGGQIGDIKSRLDFDVGESTLDKEQLTIALNQLIKENHPTTFLWIDDQELDDNPELVRTMSVQPPRGVGKIRLVKIGDSIDLQPCGGTHVNFTGEIGTVKISKIENKGKRNRRVNVVFDTQD